jgi:hypothetical protein
VPARDWDERIAELAHGQHGVVARVQLRALGMGEGAIESRVKRGRLHRFHRGVYKVGYRRISRRGRWMAAVLASGPGACLSHRSAARLWRLMPPGDEWVEVTSPPPSRARRRGIVCHEGVVAEDEWLVEDGIPVTALFRTVFDLAAVLKLRELERVWHEAEVKELRDRVSLPLLLERYPGRRGSRNLRLLLEEPEPAGFTRNDFEEAFRALVAARGIYPRPRMNAPLALRGRFSRSMRCGSARRWQSSSTAEASTGRKQGSSRIGSAIGSRLPKAGGRCRLPGGSFRRNRTRSWPI